MDETNLVNRWQEESREEGRCQSCERNDEWCGTNNWCYGCM